MHELQPYLAEHPFLRGMTPEQFDAMAPCARIVRYEADEYLFRMGEPAKHFFLLQHGRVNVEVREPGRESVTLQTVEEAGALGWSWLVPPYRWCFDARALQLSLVLVLDADYLYELCEADHDLGFSLMKRVMDLLAQRLHAARSQLADSFFVEMRTPAHTGAWTH